jgi:hypothetical protein
MAPIDYSKWNNIDTDSELKTPTEQVPPVEANPAPALATSQSAAPASTATPSTSRSIQAVIVRCDVERLKFAPWSATTIQADHPIFSQPVAPILGLIEVPLAFHRVGTWSTNPAVLDNQIAVEIRRRLLPFFFLISSEVGEPLFMYRHDFL